MLILGFCLGTSIATIVKGCRNETEAERLKKLLDQRDSINLINIRNHQIDSTQNAKAVYSPGVKGVVTNTIE